MDNRLSVSRLTRYMARCSGGVLWAMFLYVTSDGHFISWLFRSVGDYCIDIDVAYGENGWG
jgi:hypothetical protein